MRLLRRLHLCSGLHAAAKYEHEKSQKSQGRQFFMFTCDFSQFTVLVRALSTPLLPIFTDSTNFLMFCIFYNVRNFRKNCSSCRGPLNSFLYKFSLRDWTNFPFFRSFYNLRNFRKNSSSRRGPLNLLFYRFSQSQRIFQFFANFAIFAAAGKPGHIRWASTRFP